MLPGGLPGSENLGKSGAVKDLTLKVHESGGICASLCAGPAYTLAKFGLLNGRTATCYPSFEKEFDASTASSPHSSTGTRSSPASPTSWTGREGLAPYPRARSTVAPRPTS